VKYLSFFSLLSYALLLAACGTIKPDAPEIILTDIKIPDQPNSIINIPIKINLAPYFKATNESVPTTFTGKEKKCQGVSYSYKFYRQPISFTGKGSKLHFDVDGTYSLRLNYCPQCTGLFSDEGLCLIPRIYASCGVNEPKRKINVAYSLKLEVSNKYKLVSKTKLTRVKALSPCEITVFNYNATKTLEEEIEIALKDLEKDIDDEIGAADIKPEMITTWKLLSEPIDLEGYGFLDIQPSAISLSSIKFEGDSTYFNAILEAKPIIRTEIVSKIPKKLPDLSKYKRSEGFDITMDVVASYDSLSSLLTKKIMGTKIVVKGNEIIFGAISIHGAHNKSIHLKVDFEGKKKGTLYLTGTPYFNEIKQHISFPDLAFDLKTKNALLKSAKWLLNKKITEYIRASASIDLNPYLDTLKKSLNNSMNMEIDEGVFLNGKISKALINFIHPAQNQLHLRIHSTGRLELRL